MTIQEILKEFDEKFKCIQNDCDGHGNIPTEWEAGQCQFHAEYLFPIKAFLLSHLTSLVDSVPCEKTLSIKFPYGEKEIVDTIPFDQIVNWKSEMKKYESNPKKEDN
jgi:hypothetical protein